MCICFTAISICRRGRAPLIAQGFVSCQPHDAVKIHRLWLAGGSCTQPRQSFVPEKAGIICYIQWWGSGEGSAWGWSLRAAGVAKHTACYAAKQAGPGRAIKSGRGWVFNKLHATMHLHSLSCSKALAGKGQKCRAGGLKPTQTIS